MAEIGFRHRYQQQGPTEYYRRHGEEYRNPHEAAVRQGVEHAVRVWGVDCTRALDLAAGGGEVTLALQALLPGGQVEGIDPYTAKLYERRTGRPCQEVSFEAIAQYNHVLSTYSCILASCALHLVEDSWLAPLCLALASAAPHLIVITPLTRPDIRPEWGWRLVEATSLEAEGRSVRLRWYRSSLQP